MKEKGMIKFYSKWIRNISCKKMILLLGMCFVFWGVAYIVTYAEEENVALLNASSLDLVEVSKDGTKDCMTIQEAVFLAKDGGTIIIYPGVYRESIKIRDKNIALQGINRDTCVIESEWGLYQNAPLDIGCGRVTNLTIYNKAPENVDVSGDVQSYAIHCDDSAAPDQRLTINHCILISDLNYVFGIGGRKNLSIDILDCKLVSNNAGAIFYHDAPIETMAGKIQFSMKQCLIENNSKQPTFVMLSLCNKNKTHFCFQNNITIDKGQIGIPIMTKDWKSGSEWFDTYQLGQDYGPEVEAFLNIIDKYYNPPIDEETEAALQALEEKEPIEEPQEEEIEEPACNKWYGISTFYLDENSAYNTLSAMNYTTAYMTY